LLPPVLLPLWARRAVVAALAEHSAAASALEAMRLSCGEI